MLLEDTAAPYFYDFPTLRNNDMAGERPCEAKATLASLLYFPAV